MLTPVIEVTEEPVLNYEDLLKQVHAIGKDVLAEHAADVDRNARFPQEAFEALCEAKLLSAYVPTEFGGMGLNIMQIAKICEALGQYCGSSAMIYAMHCIQVACVVHHAQGSAYFRKYLRTLVDEQRLMASATTEIGTGGDLRSSVCAIEVDGDNFTLTKKAPVISYGEAADDILVTCRRSPEAQASEQVQVLVRRGEFTAEPLSTWDTMGFRGTCSSGFTLTAIGAAEQILPTPFNDILSQTMHPYSHIVWGALGLIGRVADHRLAGHARRVELAAGGSSCSGNGRRRDPRRRALSTAGRKNHEQAGAVRQRQRRADLHRAASRSAQAGAADREARRPGRVASDTDTD